MPTVTASTSFFAPGRRHVRKGERLDASDPIVKGRGSLFVNEDGAPVESATAEPGEKRAAKKTAAQSKD